VSDGFRCPEGAVSRFLSVDGFRIHYLEGGDPARPKLVLLHSCDHGSSAEFSWENNFATLAQHFHVLGPDMPGYGLSDKYYDFTHGHMPYRRRMLQRFLQLLCVEEADFIGNSCGASLLLTTAAEAGERYRDTLPIRRMVLVSPSAIGTPGPGRAINDAYDGTVPAMQRIVRSIFFSPAWAEDGDYVQRRNHNATRPGAWETIEAARLRLPGRTAAPPLRPQWNRCVAPVLFINGDHDSILAEPDGGMDNVRGIAAGQFAVVPNSGHCTQIEYPEIFHRLVSEFLR
jgi:pimeloyl-ACP methyl ester carboxylesterase